MNVAREVILDLLPVYLSGEASPATRALVEEYLRQDTELAQRLRLQSAENLAAAVPPMLPPELELRALQRTRKLVACQRWLFGLAIALTGAAFSMQFSFGVHPKPGIRFLWVDSPVQSVSFLSLGLVCWIGYFLIRRRMRSTPS